MPALPTEPSSLPTRSSKACRVRYTNKTARWKGETVPMTARVMKPVAEFVDGMVGQPDFDTRSDVIVHALAELCMKEETDAAS